MKNINKIIFLLILTFVFSCNTLDEIDTEPVKSEPPVEIFDLLSIQVLNSDLLDTLVISNRFKFKVEGKYSNGQTKDLSDSVLLEASNGVTILNENFFTTGKSGTKSITLKYKDFVVSYDFISSNTEQLPVPNYLKSTNCNIVVPVVVINLIPTDDGVRHDETRGPISFGGDFTFPNLTLTKNKLYEDTRVTRAIVEEGTRFRSYGNKSVNPYACINVVKIFNVYEWELTNWVNNIKTLDYKELFTRLNMESIMNETSFKEIWINSFPYVDYPSVVNSQFNDPSRYWNIPESNMSSPTSGDISNSYRIPDDLPIYKQTYVVYGHNGHRGVDTHLHVRGHQIEAQLRHIEHNKILGKELFWNEFVGVRLSNNNNGRIKEEVCKDGCNHHLHIKSLRTNWWNEVTALNGRAGNTHYPPNAESGYDYRQFNEIESDIRTWKPNAVYEDGKWIGGGNFEKVNQDTWTNINYGINMKVNRFNYFEEDFNKDPHTKWLLFWFQSIPGENNNIKYKRNDVEYTLTNWWDIFYNWDEAITNNTNLWK